MVNRKFWLVTIGILIALLGLYNSFKASFILNPITSDSIDTVMIWLGYHQQGWLFIKNWYYNLDNWLLSLFPLHFLLFEIFGDKPSVLLWAGFGVFITNILLCALIAYRLGARIAAAVVPLILLFSNYFAHLGGYLTFIIAHNITNAYGLICLLLTIEWTKKPRYFYLIIIFFCAVIAGISDPWFLPTYAIPILAAQLILFIRYKQTDYGRSAPWILATLFFVLLTISTQGFGVFHFLLSPSIPLANSKDIIFHLSILPRVLGRLFYLFPGSFLIKDFYIILPALFSFGIVFLFTIAVIIKVRKLISNNLVQLNFFLTIIFSIIIISVSYCLLNMQGNGDWYIKSSRYLINVLFLLILGLGVAIDLYWQSLGKTLKIAAGIVGLVYITSSFSSTFEVWKQPTDIDITKSEPYLLANFLLANNLNYGYADYWNSNIITWITHNKLRVRSIRFSEKNGYILSTYYPQTSKLWYLPSDFSPNQGEFFIIIKNSGMGCPDTRLCMPALIKQFGKPEKILTYQGHYDPYFIMVWNHPLLTTILQGPTE